MKPLLQPKQVRNPHRNLTVWGAALVTLITWGGLPVSAFPREPTPAVRKALDRGLEYLCRTQQQDGTWRSWGSHAAGETALAGMAIVAAGAPLDSPKVSLARQAVRHLISTNDETYDISLAIMFLDQVGNDEDVPLLQELGGRLLGGQLTNGAWGYGVSGLGGGDNSNTQFAAIACWVARKHGVVRDAALHRLDRYFRGCFVPSMGGWGYGPGPQVTPTMTCAGLAGLATYRGAEQERLEPANASSSQGGARKNRRVRDPVVDTALKALGQELRLADANPGHPINADLYFFWSLERVAMIYGLNEIGGVDWYRWGSARLLKGQSPDGQWRGSGKWEYDQAVGTSFAVLFLSRLNVAADLTAAVGLGGGSDEGPPAPAMEPDGGSGGSRFLRLSPPQTEPVGRAAAPESADQDQNLDPRRGRP